ncbi:hypothetical protein M569_10426 [Genlisea aurea]|uniref:Uncharacterized protein n=1 Tax=Genlisea aurea TaxID=192259 RepID=S8CBX3_9LAMI|nr:hypothetical protein M569_10426 [Genlisea aurea]
MQYGSNNVGFENPKPVIRNQSWRMRWLTRLDAAVASVAYGLLDEFLSCVVREMNKQTAVELC